MPPVFVTPENVTFNGILTDSVVLDTIGPIKKLFPWDKLSPALQAQFEDSVDLYGGVLPIPQTSAKCVFNFGGAVVGGDSTGLVGAKTPGEQSINFGSAVGGDSTNFPVVVATAGLQITNYPIITILGDPTGLDNTTPTAGTQGIDYLSSISGIGDSTGLDNSVFQVSQTQTIADVAGSLNNSYFTFVSGSGSFYVWYDVNAAGVDPAPGGTGIQVSLITNETNADVTTKSVSAINLASAGVSALGTAANLFEMTMDVAGPFTAPSSIGGGVFLHTILTAGALATIYTTNIVVDGGASQLLTLPGATVATFGTLISEINLQLSGAVITLVGGDLLITSSSTGASSSILITDVDLFSSAVGFVILGGIINGVGNTVYTLTVSVDGGANQALNIQGSDVQTFTTLGTELTSALTGATGVLDTNGEFIITSSTSGASSSINIVSGNLLSSVTGFISTLPGVPGVGSTTFDAVISVDGVNNNISVDGTVASTFTTLVAEINTDLTGAVATLVAGQIEIVSASVGNGSSIKVISDTSLFKNVDGYINIGQPILGTEPVNLKLKVEVNQVEQIIEIDQTLATTYTDLIAEINSGLTGAVASIVSGNIEIVSAALGELSSMESVDLGLLRNLALYESFKCYPGVEDTLSFMENVEADNGSSWVEQVVAITDFVGLTPVKPPGAINKNLVYFDGSAFLHLFDDSPV